MARSFSVLLADSNIFLREKIAGILSRQENVWCVLQVSGRAPLLRGAREHQPDLILADITLLGDRQFGERLRQGAPGSRLVAMVDIRAEPYLKAADMLGVDNVVEKAKISNEVQREFRALRRRNDDPDVESA